MKKTTGVLRGPRIGIGAPAGDDSDRPPVTGSRRGEDVRQAIISIGSPKSATPFLARGLVCAVN